MRIVLAGGSGFLGTALRSQLQREVHDVAVLTRRATHKGDVPWDPTTPGGEWMQSINGAGAVVNLAGESIAGGRWTAARKRAIRNSRVEATTAIRNAVERAAHPPAVWINGSAVGIYGSRNDELLTEASAPGTGFLPSVGQAWENAAGSSRATTRLVFIRTGIVLDRSGGALPQMALPFHVLAGGPVGSGRQYMSWIHLEDWVRLAVWTIGESRVSGPLNATAPHPVTNREFTRVLGRVLKRPAIVPAPAFALRLALGEMSEIILEGQNVIPAKAMSNGFEFRYPSLEPALRAIYGR